MEKHYKLMLNATELYLLRQFLKDNNDHLPSISYKIDKIVSRNKIRTPDDFEGE